MKTSLPSVPKCPSCGLAFEVRDYYQPGDYYRCRACRCIWAADGLAERGESLSRGSQVKTKEHHFVHKLGRLIGELAQEEGFECEELEQGFYRIHREGYPAIVVSISALVEPALMRKGAES
jgi:hypothetical protein